MGNEIGIGAHESARFLDRLGGNVVWERREAHAKWSGDRRDLGCVGAPGLETETLPADDDGYQGR